MGGGASSASVPAGIELTALVDAALGSDAEVLASARRAAWAAVGGAGLIDAAAAIASFNAVVKIADGTGIPLEDWKHERTRDIRAALGIDSYRME